MVRLPPPTDEDEFEDIVASALRVRHDNVHLLRFGRSGQGQHGIDGWETVAPRGLVFQATLQRERLIAKLTKDLASFDASGLRSPSVFLFVTAIQRDSKLQGRVDEISVKRLESKKCPVEILFWDDLRPHFSPELISRHYRDFVAPNVVAPSITRGLLALGWDIIVEASLLTQARNSWRFRLGTPIVGDLRSISRFVDTFDARTAHAWSCFSGLGTGRALVESPVLQGDELILPLSSRAPRSSVYEERISLALGDDGDIFPDLRALSGFSAALQEVRLAMSTRLGEWFADRSDGTRCAVFHQSTTDRRRLGAMLMLELARLAFLTEEQSNRLSFIESVVDIDVPSTELLNGELHTTATLLLSEHGEWRGPLRILISPQLARAQEQPETQSRRR